MVQPPPPKFDPFFPKHGISWPFFLWTSSIKCAKTRFFLLKDHSAPPRCLQGTDLPANSLPGTALPRRPGPAAVLERGAFHPCCRHRRCSRDTGFPVVPCILWSHCISSEFVHSFSRRNSSHPDSHPSCLPFKVHPWDPAPNACVARGPASWAPLPFSAGVSPFFRPREFCFWRKDRPRCLSGGSGRDGLPRVRPAGRPRGAPPWLCGRAPRPAAHPWPDPVSFPRVHPGGWGVLPPVTLCPAVTMGGLSGTLYSAKTPKRKNNQLRVTWVVNLVGLDDVFAAATPLRTGGVTSKKKLDTDV